MYQKTEEMTACPRCGSDLHFRGDYPQCLMCGFEDYSVPPLTDHKYAQYARAVLFEMVEGPKRLCEDCGSDLSDRYYSARFCLPCLKRRHRAQSERKVANG